MQKVGVTGGSGFIGGHVIEELLQAGYEVVLFDRLDKRPDKWIAKIAKVFMFQGDIRDANAVTEFAGMVDGIIHLAGTLGTQETTSNPRPAFETNVQGGLNVFEAANQYNLPVVNIGVGNHFMNNPYAISKSTVERMAHFYNNDRGGKITTVRAVNAYGPRQSAAAPYGPSKVRKITPSFICRALASQPIEVYGDGNQVSDMVYVGDVAAALVQALRVTNSQNRALEKVIEVGPSEHTTVKEMAELVAQLCEAKGYPQAGIKHLPMRPGEIPGAQVTADNLTLHHIGMSPDSLTSLELGLAETVQWFIDKKDQVWHDPNPKVVLVTEE
jgi:nucleoside-diphosphate-sugar epimerase